jgi:hypothetical protein
VGPRNPVARGFSLEESEAQAGNIRAFPHGSRPVARSSSDPRDAFVSRPKDVAAGLVMQARRPERGAMAVGRWTALEADRRLLAGSPVAVTRPRCR